MEKIFEHIDTKYNTDFYFNFNSLEPKKVKSESLFGDESWEYFAKNIGTKKHPHFEFDDTKKSAKDEKTFEENYGNPLCGVQHSRRIISVEKTNEKVSIKLFLYERLRKPGRPYFVKSTGLHFLTYNYRTNSLYYGSLINYHLKRKCKKTLRRAGLWEDPIDVFKNKIKNFFDTSFTFAGVNVNNFDINIPIQKFIDSIPNINEVDDDPKYSLYKHILVTGGIKLPNNWKTLIEVYPQPKKTDYKKVGFKYVDAFMLINKMSGDKLKRVLHTLNKINFSSYHFMLKFFGPEFLLSKPDSDLKLILESETYFGDWYTDVEFTKSELKNSYVIFMEACLGNIDYSTIIDHINFKQTLIKYQPVKWKSKTFDEFIDEHDEWSKLISSYTDGVTTRRYGRDFTNIIQEPISINGDVYYPVLLANTDEYNNESTVQTNCVRTYINRPDCFIISLRKGDLNSNERLTNEFALSVVKDELKIKRVQTKAKRNSQPDITWSDVLNMLDEKVEYLHKQKLFTLPEKDIEYKLGVGKHSEAIIYNNNNYSTIVWDDKIPEMNLHESWFFPENDFDDLPL
jgi:hypothetical protein